MQSLLFPVLVLATVALSSSNVLPILSMNELNAEPVDFNYQDNDNTFSKKQQSKTKFDAILFNVDVEPELEKIPQADYLDNEDETSKDDNYNVKGFRKDQWHNYPRQLDRLNRYFHEHHNTDKRNLDPDDPGNTYGDESVDGLERSLDAIEPNELNLQKEPETRKINNEAEVAAAVINPLLVFRIHLAYYNNDLVDQRPQLETTDVVNGKLQNPIKEERSFMNEDNPELSLTKVKREGKMNLEDIQPEHKSSKNRTMNKRIFSLWSRLQSLNPKGHQLHHRRHLYALYGLPESEGGGGGVLTAETRATFMRPPGSPLRWG